VQLDQGLYEERYRLTGSMIASLVVSLALLAAALHGAQGSAYLAALGILTFVTVTAPVLLTMMNRKIAFRVDPMGITLGGDPMTWASRSNSGVFIPWSDVEKIVIYRGTAGRPGVGIQRREGATPLPKGNEPARRCPVPGVAEGATRQTVGWRLDRERLTAFLAAMAPGIPLIDAPDPADARDPPDALDPADARDLAVAGDPADAGDLAIEGPGGQAAGSGG
jgi:hypothetical protein